MSHLVERLDLLYKYRLLQDQKETTFVAGMALGEILKAWDQCLEKKPWSFGSLLPDWNDPLPSR